MQARERMRHCPATCLFLLMLLAIALALGTGWRAQRMKLQRQMTGQKLATLQARIATVDPDLASEYEVHLHELQLRHFVGEESRLVLVESIQNAASESQLTNVTYALGPRVPLSTAVAVGVSAPVETSPVRVNLRLRRSDQLSTFFDRLNSRGLYWARKCLLRMHGDPSEQSGIEVSCELLWMTVKSPAA